MKEFLALLDKNFKLWSRSTFGCCCEIATTVLFALLILLIANAAEVTDKPGTSYLSKLVRISPDSSLMPIPPAIPNLNYPNNYIQCYTRRK